MGRGSKPARSTSSTKPHPQRAEFFALPYHSALTTSSPIRPFAHSPFPAARETFHLLLMTATILCSYGHNGACRIRFQSRRQHHLFPTRCLYQLDAQKLTLADADGPGLLRH